MQVVDYVVNNILANRYLIVSLVAFYAFAFLLARRAAQRGQDPDGVWSTAIWMGLGALLVGYAGFILINLPSFIRDPGLLLGNVGVTFYGVLAGGLAGAWFGARRAGLSVRYVAMLAAPLLPLVIALDRLGCVVGFNACLGGAMDAPFGIILPGNDVPRFPSHIVEGVLTLLVAGAVFLLERKKARAGLAPFVLGVGAYVLIRSAVDFTRLPINVAWIQIEITLGFFIAFLAAGYLIMRALSPRLTEVNGAPKTKDHWQIQPHRARAPRRRRSEGAAPVTATNPGKESAPQGAAPSSGDHK